MAPENESPTKGYEADWVEDEEDWTMIAENFQKQDTAGEVIAVVVLIIGLFGLAANSQIFLFYWKRRTDLVPSLYLALSSTDFVVSLTAILHFVALLLLVTDQKESLGMTGFLAAVFTITTLILRVSVFVNVVLIVVRTINITRPFYQINRTVMWVSLAACILILIPLIIFDAVRIKQDQEDYLATKVKYVFLPFVGDYAIRDIVMAANGLTPKSNKVVRVPEYVTFATSCAPFIVAVLVALVCLVVNYRTLKASKTGLGKSGGGKAEHDITVTITMLTTVFSVCNTVYSLWIVVFWAADLNYWTTQWVLQLCYVTSTIFPFISSSLNPIILIWRSKALRESLRNKFRCKKKVAGETSFPNSTVLTTFSTAD